MLNTPRIDQSTPVTARPTSDAPVGLGLVADTLLETPTGWRRADQIGVGDLVQTFDGGLRPVTALRRAFYARPAVAQMGLAPLRLRGGQMNACGDLWLLPAQQVLTSAPQHLKAQGHTHALISAASLVGQGQATRAPLTEGLSVTLLGFDEPEILWANTGVLLYAPAAGAWEAAPTIYPTAEGPAEAKPGKPARRTVVLRAPARATVAA